MKLKKGISSLLHHSLYKNNHPTILIHNNDVRITFYNL